ncbi:uncharacterized protein LOC110854594 isoform X1 [Folsomia candida]|uniref:uncharacterized protein LOC110854594 isoform X1 n=1 Tax=Folsomia candida TaxID=158441 RepID=UPI0016050BD3|nr:uncharacterized protein LOC110854594 isoform X1 [Folsomia candida]XP_035711422.1 uncharacterized protein LOC110854594 isoform X1 [Folsomia candida]XP_035711424.1 uncharacterized protein LOC110854594 isoform X1 [Folsomia candida]
MEGLLARVDYLENIVSKLAKWTHFCEVVNFDLPSVVSLENGCEKVNAKSSKSRRRGRRSPLPFTLSPGEVTNPNITSDETVIKTEEEVDTFEEMQTDDDPDFVIFPQTESFQIDSLHPSASSSSNNCVGDESSLFSTGSTLTVVESNKGKPIVLHDGYSFNFRKSGVDKAIWVCERLRRDKCNARLHTSLNVSSPTLLKELGSHNHSPNPISCEVREIRTKIRKDAKATSDNPATIIARNVSQASAETKGTLPLRQHLKRTIRSIRASGSGSRTIPHRR